MFKKFKAISIDDNTIKRTAKKDNNVIEEFSKFSFYFDVRHENDIDLIKQINK